MKKLLTVLFVFIGLFASAQKLDSIRGAGFIWERGMFNKSLGIPTVCGVPKTNYTDSTKKAQIIYDSCAGKFYAYNPATESWSEPGGGGVSGVDSVTIVQTGCAFTFYTWQAGVSTPVGTLSQYNGVSAGTGLVTHTSGLTFTVAAAVYAIDCVTYVTRDTTITLPAAGDTGRIDVIKVNTSSVTTYGQGVEGEALPLPSLSSTELALTYILVTDTGVFVLPPADTALWVSVGNEIRNANTGRVRIKRDLQVGNYTPGAWDTTGVHTNTFMVAQDGFYLSNPSNGSLNKTGIGQGFGNAANIWAGGNIIGSWRLVGNNAGNQFNISSGYNPASGGGFASTFSSTTTLSPTGANSINYTVFDASPTYTQGVLGTGTLRGFWYRPSVTSLNTSRNIAIETMSGDIIHRNLAGSGTRMVVANDSGLLSTQAIPGGGGGATTLEEAFINGNVFTQTNRIAAQGNSFYIDSTNEFKVHSQFNRGAASQMLVKIAGITMRSEGDGVANNIELSKYGIAFSSTDSVNFQMSPPVSSSPDYALGMVNDRVYRIPYQRDSTIYFESPLEVYTSGDSTKVRVNADTLFKWRYGIEKTFTIDLSLGDYTITEPGIYIVTHGDITDVNEISFPDPTTMPGASITILNNDTLDNYVASYDLNKPLKVGNGPGSEWDLLAFPEMHTYKSIGNYWHGGSYGQ